MGGGIEGGEEMEEIVWGFLGFEGKCEEGCYPGIHLLFFFREI